MYPRNFFSVYEAEVIIGRLMSDDQGGDAEGFGIAVAKCFGMSINIRMEGKGSFAFGRSADKGFSAERPGITYFNPLKCSISIPEFKVKYISYHHQRENYTEDQVNDNGRTLVGAGINCHDMKTNAESKTTPSLKHYWPMA